MREEKMKPQAFRAIRIKLNLSQQSMGEALGYATVGARQRVWEVEHGIRPIMPVRIKLLRILEDQMEGRPPRSVHLPDEQESQS